MPLLDVLPNKETRNVRLNGDRTLNHRRNKSRLSQGILSGEYDGDLDGAHRKAVNFAATSNKESDLLQRDEEEEVDDRDDLLTVRSKKNRAGELG